MAKRIRLLTLSFDDSTTFVAKNFSQVQAWDRDVACYNALLKTKGNLQYVARVSDDPFFDTIEESEKLFEPSYLRNFDAIFLAKIPPGFAAFCERTKLLDSGARPAIMAGFPGLELSPRHGFRNRLLADVIVFNTRADLDVFARMYEGYASEKILVVGNPTVLAKWLSRRQQAAEPLPDRQPHVVFLAQNISPPTLAQRVSLLEALTTQTRRVPIIVKVRQKENVGHVHHEQFPYPFLARREGIELPFLDCTMDNALLMYDRFLSCSSTGVFEAAALGKKVGQIARFEGWQHDGLHIAGLGYTVRYGLEVGLDQPLDLAEISSAFFDDFELHDDNRLLHIRAIVAEFRERQVPRGAMRRVEKAQQRKLSDHDVNRLYFECGNLEKALFLCLRSLAKSSRSSSDRLLVLSCLELMDRKSELFRSYVAPVLGLALTESELEGLAQEQSFELIRGLLTPPQGSSENIELFDSGGFAVPTVNPWQRVQSTMVRGLIRVLGWWARLFMSKRKAAKFHRDPERFLLDSKHALIRALGAGYRAPRLKGRSS